MIEKRGKLIPIQIKAIQRKASICWNISLAKIVGHALLYVLANLNADTMQQPEYFVLTEAEVKQHFKSTDSGRDYLDYNLAIILDLQDAWHKVTAM